jgi:multimeric flavodoxin WrbA
MKVLGLSSSPRLGGNTDLLLDEFLRGVRDSGGEAEKICLAGLNISACTQCDVCLQEGVCCLEDDMVELYAKIEACDCLVLASPIYFMAHCAQAKLFIDRCQVFWARKYVLKQPADKRVRRGFHIAVGATRGPAVFAGVKTTMRWVFDALGMEYAGDVLAEGVAGKGAVADRPDVLEEAYRQGQTAGK